MPSPFPGMDPYLEGHLWPDLHSALAGKLRAALTLLLRPHYTARLAVSVIEDAMPGDVVRLVNIEIRDAAQQQLVTAIEILSPVNKREPGLTQYQQKRQRLYAGGVHLIELDLLRRGTRPIAHPRLPDVPYLIALTRAGTGATDVWALRLRERLPIIPVPLLAPDDDVLLDLQGAFAAAYDEAAYELSIDYAQPPPPPALPAGEVE